MCHFFDIKKVNFIYKYLSELGVFFRVLANVFFDFLDVKILDFFCKKKHHFFDKILTKKVTFFDKNLIKKITFRVKNLTKKMTLRQKF